MGLDLITGLSLTEEIGSKMNLNEFSAKNEFLYHLTDNRNFANIINQKRILSTTGIVELSNIENKEAFLRSKRNEHTIININGTEYRIRDQRPISLIVLNRSLTHGWNSENFIEHLNRRVFLWPNKNRLIRHYNRYANENPIILRFRTEDIFLLNPNVEFSRLNSGATRCSSHWDGNAPERGPETFQNADAYTLPIRTVAEVTIPDFCEIPSIFHTSGHPEGPWTRIDV